MKCAWRWQTTPVERIDADRVQLSEVGHRFAGTEGEREMLHEVKRLLPDQLDGRIEGFVSHAAPGLVLAIHAALLLLGGLIGFRFPGIATVVCALLTASLVAETSGRVSAFRWVTLKAASYNLVAHLAAPTRPLGTVVLAAPLDLPRWRPMAVRLVRRPFQFMVGAAVFVTILLALRTMAEPWSRPTLSLYIAALAILGVSIAVGLVTHQREWHGKGDAAGPAVLIELGRRLSARPVDGVDVWTVFTGCGHAYNGGMHAFLALRGHELQGPVLVVALDDPGTEDFGAAVSEGSLRPQHYRSTGPALVERLRWAGVDVPVIDKPGNTDARAAMLRGFRALAITGGHGIATPSAAARAADVVETVVRWFGEDLTRVADQAPQLQDLVRAACDEVPVEEAS